MSPPAAPTTKQKQRDFLDALIDGVNHGMYRDQIIRQLRILRKQLHNRPARKGRITSPPRHRVRRQIIILHSTRPELSMQEIAQKLKTSIGRVSETLRGKRR